MKRTEIKIIIITYIIVYLPLPSYSWIWNKKKKNEINDINNEKKHLKKYRKKASIKYVEQNNDSSFMREKIK